MVCDSVQLKEVEVEKENERGFRDGKSKGTSRNTEREREIEEQKLFELQNEEESLINCHGFYLTDKACTHIGIANNYIDRFN